MVQQLHVYNVTFNCARALIEPKPFGRHLFDGWKGSDLPHLLVLNLQELAPIGYAFTADRLVEAYFDGFRQAVKHATAQQYDKQGQGAEPTYLNVVSRKCGLTAIMVFVREDFVDEIQHLAVAEVGVGLSQMGNKGAVGVRVSWRLPTSNLEYMATTFVSAHLAPFEAQIEHRNQDYKDVVRGLVFTSEDARQSTGTRPRHEPLLTREDGVIDGHLKKLQGIYASDAHLIFSGDLNYRTALSTPSPSDVHSFPQPCSSSRDERHFSHLLEKDQLSLERDAGRTLHGLSEEMITFPPSYKYRADPDRSVTLDSDMDRWDWANHRWPSWCDRILYSQIEGDNTRTTVSDYCELPLFGTSDHRPVALSLKIPLQPVHNELFATKAPASINQRWRQDREAARARELAVGISAYLTLTIEGRILLAAAIGAVLSGLWLSGSLGG